MTTQPEALRLAEVSPYLEGGERGRWIIDAAAELRRLAAVETQRDALLEALRDLMARLDPYDYPDEQNFARAAIKQVEEGQ